MNKAGYLLPRYVCFTDAETNANQTWGAPQWRSKQDAVGTQREEHGFQLKGVEANELARNVFYIDFYLSCLLKWNQPTIANLTSLWSFTWTSVGGSVTGKPLSLYCISRTLLDSCICSRFLGASLMSVLPNFSELASHILNLICYGLWHRWREIVIASTLSIRRLLYGSQA